MFVAEFLLLVMAVMAIFPETPLARHLRRLLVEAPAKLLSETTFKQAVLGILSSLTVAAIFILAPEIFALLAAIGDVSVLVDVILLVSALGIRSSLQNAYRRARDTIAAATGVLGCAFQKARRLARVRDKRRRKPGKSIRPPSEDPDIGFAFS